MPNIFLRQGSVLTLDGTVNDGEMILMHNNILKVAAL